MKADAEVEIGGTTYILKCIPTRKGEVTFLRLCKMLLPTATFLTPTQAKKQIISAMDSPDFFDKVLNGLADRLSPTDLMDIVETVLEPVQVYIGNGDSRTITALKPIIDSHFAGEYENLHKVFFSALNHNYGSFFLDIHGVVKMIPIFSRLLMETKKTPTTPNT